MTDITRDRIKAFLDDLALISAKHGLEICTGGNGGRPALISNVSGAPLGYTAIDDEDWHPPVLHTGRFPSEAIATSLDVSTFTAHQRLALERSLREIGEQSQ